MQRTAIKPNLKPRIWYQLKKHWVLYRPIQEQNQELVQHPTYSWHSFEVSTFLEDQAKYAQGGVKYTIFWGPI